MNLKHYLISITALAYVLMAAPLHAQEDGAGEGGAPTMTPPALPANLTPPPGPPPSAPPELPEFLKNRRSATARGASAAEQAADIAPGGASQERMQSPERAALLGTETEEAMATEAAIEALESEEALQATGRGQSEISVPNPEEMVARITLVDDSALTVLSMIEQMTGKAVLRMQSLPAIKINFDSQGPMSKREAITAMESLLSLNGVAVTELGDKFLKAVPVANAPQQVPVFITGTTLGMAPSQAIYTKLFSFEYLAAVTEAQPIIQPLMSSPAANALVAFPKSNSLLVTDALSNLQRIEQVLADADKPQENPVEVRFFQLENVKARDLQSRLQSLITNQSSALYKYTVNNTIIEADERTNQIILMTHPSNLEMLSGIIEKLDINIEPSTTSRVFYIKHAKAPDIDALLEEIITGQQQVAEDSGSNNRQRTNQPQNPQAQVIKTGIDTSGMRFSEYITIVADERSNAIVAYGTKADLEQIAKIIDEIDVLLAQVHIQVIIAEVKLSKNQLDGLSELGLGYSATEGFYGSASGPSTSNIDAPFDISWSVRTSAIDGVIRNAVKNDKAVILSAPVVVTTHNQEATVNVSESRPFITASSTSTEGSGGAVTNSVQYRDVGIQLKVTPLIGSNGVVQMEIEQVVENIIAGAGVEVNGTLQPYIDKREATSFVSVTDNETIVLAGLQQSEMGDNRGKLWLLGEIPILGDLLFSNTAVSDTRRELMMFITPRVIYSQKEATEGADEAIRNLDNGRDVNEFLRTRDISEVFSHDEAEQKVTGLGAETSELRRRPHK